MRFGAGPWRRVVSMLLAVALVSCGGGSGDGGGGTPPPGGATATVLSAPSGTLVEQAVTDVLTGDPVAPGEVETDPAGRRVVRTKLGITFRKDATVDEVNAVFARHGAVVTASVAGTRSVVVRVPDPGDLGGLDALVAAIEAEPAVWFATRSVYPEAKLLPGGLSPTGEFMSTVSHHLAAGAGGLWSAQGAAPAYPTAGVVVMDFFGGGPLYAPDAGASVTAADYAATGETHSHGYHVAGIIEAGLDGTAGTTELVTGMDPALPDLAAVDLTGPLGFLDAQVAALDRAKALLDRGAVTPRTVVFSASLGYDCDGAGGRCIDEGTAREAAVAWIEMVRARGLEDHLLHVVAAGNVVSDLPTIRDAATGSKWSAARLLSGLTDEDGNPVASLANVMVVENAVADTEPPYAPKCLAQSSFIGGTISGIGTNVYSYVDGAGNADIKTGTSMATPQVSGLAAFLAAVRPDLDAAGIRQRIEDTARVGPFAAEAGCSDVAASPFIDAFAAALTLDKAEALDGGDPPTLARVRSNLLDVSDDFEFTETDVQTLLTAIDETPGALPGVRTWGRADLNNDGFEGGDGRAPFDLDMDYEPGSPPVYGTAKQTLPGGEVAFDENAVTDLQVLCYYAYSPFYTGDPDARDTLMEPYLADCGQALIAFHSDHEGDYEVYVMRPDGTDERNLTDAAGDDFLLSWSGDGAEVVAGPSGAYLARDIATGATRPIAPFGKAFSPDFAHSVVDELVGGWSTFRVADAFGGRVDLFRWDDPYTGTVFRYSPDGSQIAMSLCDWDRVRADPEGDTECFFELYVAPGTGGAPVAWTTFHAQTAAVDDDGAVREFWWSPDGTRVAVKYSYNSFVAPDTTNFLLIGPGSVVDLTGFTDNQASQWRFVPYPFSPDGSKLLLRYANTLYAVDAVAGGVTELATFATSPRPLNESRGPATWAPDGTWLVATTADTLYRVEADGSGTTPLLSMSGADFSRGLAGLSPDGTRILLEHRRYTETGTEYRIEVMRADGTGLTTLGPGSFSLWRPVPGG